MPVISECSVQASRIAVLSDTHVGSGNSVLDDAERGGYDAFRAFLRERHCEVDTVLLLGDIFELSLATYAETLASAEQLISVLFEFCDHIIYVPGNHDHHLWQLVNEEEQVVRKFPHVAAALVHAERAYVNSFLSAITDKAGGAKTFSVAYPNVYWEPPANNRGTYVFHHGHFCQETYRIISEIYNSAFGIETPDVEDLESLNAGWLELVWYHLGQSGAGAGANGLLEKLYEQLRGGHRERLEAALQRLYARRFSPLVHQALAAAAKETWYLPAPVAEWIAGAIDKRAPQILSHLIEENIAGADPGASRMRDREIDRALADQCWGYLEHLRQGSEVLRGRNLAFVFGHTHVADVWPKERPHLFNDGAWILGHDGEWPNANVLVCEADGSLTMHPFPPRGTPAAPPRTFPFAPAEHEPPPPPA